MEYYVLIVPYSEARENRRTYEKKLHCPGRRNAERVQRGADINLDHDKYFTVVVDEEELKAWSEIVREGDDK